MAEAIAHLRNYPTSPRKMRYVVDLIRGLEVNRALEVLAHLPHAAAKPLQKLITSAVKNWELKEEELARQENRSVVRAEDAALYIKTIYVNGGSILKRWLPAPQGRAYKIRKRSNHVTVIIDAQVAQQTDAPQQPEESKSRRKQKKAPTTVQTNE
ncbi:MAG: 50S ribosomal protein L22 [Chitinophagales bacterium]|nr:50S ribosomal protein L22 [Chitinophagales bacterium]MDW8427558.1 50S ribosomal protein L22 [Chitinophagales bacterium]